MPPFTEPISEKIHQPSDLNRGYRTILAEAKAGRAILRDSDGVGLVIMPFQRLESLEIISSATANFVSVQRALTHDATVMPPTLSLGDWTWLRVFDPDDVVTFLNEFSEVLAISAREQDAQPVIECVAAWRATAHALTDPARREILLEPATPDDFVEVDRPSEVPEAAGAEA